MTLRACAPLHVAAASLAALLAVGLLARRGAWSPRPGWSPGFHQHQQHRRLGGERTSAQLRLHMCSLPFAGSDGRFELSFPSNPETSSFRLIPGDKEHFEATVPIVGPQPTSIALRTLNSNGLCLQGLSLDGVEVQGGLPLWLDYPCIGNGDYGGIPCKGNATWQLSTTTSILTTTTTSATRTTTSTVTTATTTTTSRTSITTTTTATTQTTTTSTTRTTTTTTTSSSTSTTATGTTATATTLTTTTSSTSTTTLFVVLNGTVAPETPLTAFATAVAPPAFFDELHGELEIDVKWTAGEPRQLADFKGPIVEAITHFVGLAPPSFMRCSLRQPSSERLVAGLDVRIQPGSGTSAEDVQRLLRDPFERVRLNKLLALIGAPADELELVAPADGFQPAKLGVPVADPGRSAAAGGSRGVAAGNSSHAYEATCQEGAVFCCVRAVVDNIVHNAGVVHAYRGYFLMAVTLSAAIFCVTVWATCPCPSDQETHSEEERGRLVMPLFSIAVSFQAALFLLKSVEKHQLLVHNCEEDTPLGACPPSPWAMVVEMVIFGGGLLLGLATFGLWWYRRWRSDCRAERLQRRLRRHVVSPLESMLRRSDFFACYEVRATDRASRTEFLLELVLNVLLSEAVTLTSFFALQRYSFPSGLTAWFPYKLFYELFIACGLKIAMRKVARSKMLGSFTFAFLCSSIAMLFAVNAWLWITIARTFLDMESGFDAWRIMRLLDIAVGAGIVNCILSPLSVSFSLYFFSVYAYEPHWRSHVLQCVHLVNPEAQADEVAALLGEDRGDASEGSWELAGVRTARGEPVRLPGLPLDESSADEEESFPCITGQPSSTSKQSAAERVVDSLVGAAKVQPRRSHPLIVDLRNRQARSCASRMVCIFDYLLSVDSRLPVMRGSSGKFDELISEEDEDDYESSETDGPSPGSASETSGASATETEETSEDGPGRPPRSRMR